MECRKTGLLVIGGTRSKILTEMASSLRSAGADFQKLDTVDCRRQYPMINFDDDQSAILDPEAGILLANKALGVLQVTAFTVFYMHNASELVYCLP